MVLAGTIDEFQFAALTIRCQAFSRGKRRKKGKKRKTKVSGTVFVAEPRCSSQAKISRFARGELTRFIVSRERINRV